MTTKKRQHTGGNKQAAFLAAYVRTANITKAAKAAKIDRSLHYEWANDDERYAAAFGRAQAEAGELLDSEAIRRAYEGVLEPVIYQGEICFDDRYDEKTGITKRGKKIVIRKYSDALMIHLLKGFMPAKYRDRGSLEVSGPGGGPIPLDARRLQTLTDEELATITALARKLAATGDDGSGDQAAQSE